MKPEEYQSNLDEIRKVIAEAPQRVSVKPERYNECLGRLWNVVHGVMPRRPYHNIGHARDVMQRAEYLGRKEGLTEHKVFLLKGVGITHDINPDSELFGALYCIGHLIALKYSPEDIETHARLTLSTKYPTHPRDLMEMVICDADVDNFGRKDFFEKGELVREEMGITDEAEWYTRVYTLLRNHRYYTGTEQRESSNQLRKNIAELEKRLRKIGLPLIVDSRRSMQGKQELHEGNQSVNPSDELHEGIIGAEILTLTPRYGVN